MDELKIKLEAKEIMDNFMSSLDSIELEEDFILSRKSSYRLELNKSVLGDESFKNSFLANAPRLSGDAILANKGDWTKNE